MPLTDLDVLREIHSRGNTSTHQQIWPIVRNLVLGSPGAWSTRVRSMAGRHLVEVEYQGERPVKLTLLQAGMDLIMESGHACEDPWCHPLEATASG